MNTIYYSSLIIELCRLWRINKELEEYNRYLVEKNIIMSEIIKQSSEILKQNQCTQNGYVNFDELDKSSEIFCEKFEKSLA